MSRFISKLLSQLQASRARGKRPPQSKKVPRLAVELLEARNLLTSFTPLQIRHAYGFDRVGFGDANHTLIYGNGAGQTIGIIDSFDDPSIASNLATFDATYGLPAPPSFTKVNQRGGTAYPAPNARWAQEIALDVEYAHAMAPGANILLVEADNSGSNNQDTAVQYAANHGAVAVSMSYGSGESSGETSRDSVFTHANVTYLSSTGDIGAPGHGYPAYSPNVVAVGGTSLFLDGSGNYSSESGWAGSGGGISQFESQPFYQAGVVTQSTTRRTIPDIAFDANLSTGVIIYDTYGGGGFYTIGGTSVSCPIMAGLTAVVNQGDAYLFHQSSYSSTNFLNALYHLPQSDITDVLTGNNGFAAGPGYDLVTGRGTPIVDRFVSAMDGGPVYNPLTGELLVTGGAHGSTDNITLNQSGSRTVVGISYSIPLPGSNIPTSQTFFFNPGQLNSITISTSDGSTTVNVLNATGVTVNLEDHGNTTVNVGTAHNTVNLWETDPGTTTTIHGSSSMTVNVGKSGSVQNIKGAVVLDNPPSATTVNVDDSADSIFHTATVGVTSFGSSTYEYVSGLAPGVIYAKWGDTGSLAVQTGSGGATVNVLGTRFTTNIFSNSFTTINVGSGNSVSDVQGALNLENERFSDTVNINDQNDTPPRTTTIDTVTRSGDSSLGRLFGLSVAPITWDYLDTSAVNVNFGSGTSVVNVLGTGVPTNLLFSSSAATINVGNAGSVQGVLGHLFVEAFGAHATLNVDDSADTAPRAATLRALSNTGFINEIAPTEIQYVFIDGVTVRGGLGANTFTISNTPSGIPVTLFSGSGNGDTVNVQATNSPLTVNVQGTFSTVNVGSATNTLDAIQGIVNVNGQGSTAVNLNDQGTTAAQSYVFLGDGSNAGAFFRAFFSGVVNYRSVASVTLNGGRGGNTVGVTGTPVNTTVTVNPGTGANTVNMGSSLTPSSTLDFIRGVVNVNGQGSTAVNLNDQGTTAAQSYVFLGDGSNAGAFFRAFFSGVVNYRSVASVTLNGGRGGNTVGVTGTPVNTTVTVNPGTGANTVNMGSSLTPSSTLDFIRGIVNVNGQGSTAVNLNDQGTTAAQSYVFLGDGSNAGAFFRAFFSGVVNYRSVASVTLNGGRGGNTVAVAGSPAGTALTVNPGTGANNTVNVGSSLTPSSILDLIRGVVNVNGQGSTTLNVNDQGASPGQSYTVTAGTLDRTGAARMTFSSVQSLVLNTGTSNPWATLVYIQGTAAGTALTVKTGSGNGIAIGNAANSLDDLRGPVTIQGQLNDNFSVADVGSSTGHTYTLSAVPSISPTANRLTRSGAAPITYIGMNVLQMTGGVGDNTFNIESLAANNFVTRIYGGGGRDVFNVSPQAHDLDNLSGILALQGDAPGQGRGNASLIVNDQGHMAARNWLFETGALVAFPSAGSAAQGIKILFDVFNSVVTNAGGGGTTVNVVGTTAGTAARVDGGGGTNTLVGPNTANTWNLTAQNAGNLNGAISFTAFQNLTGGGANDAFNFSSGVSLSGALNGGGSNTLDLSAFTTNLTVNVTGADAGSVAGVVGSFAAVGNFTGGSGTNSFAFGDGASLSGTLNGGSGGGNTLDSSAYTTNEFFAITGANAGSGTPAGAFVNIQNLVGGGGGGNYFQFAGGASLGGNLTGGGGATLDYSAYATSVTVDLQPAIASATGVGGSISGITVVVGGSGAPGTPGLYNLLIGSDVGGDYLQGGTGRRNILVAGGGASTLVGGDGEDLLIAGYTTYDTEVGLGNWQAIAAYWAGTDDFATRAANLASGSGVPILDPTAGTGAVFGNGGGNILQGSGGAALVYTDNLDTISGFGSTTLVTITP